MKRLKVLIENDGNMYTLLLVIMSFSLILVVFSHSIYADVSGNENMGPFANGNSGFFGSIGEDNFCGISTEGPCEYDSECITGGCSGQVCESRKNDPLITSCMEQDCQIAENYNLRCRCIEKGCQWI